MQRARNLPTERFFWPALLASVALHGVVLGSLLTHDFAIAPLATAPREYVEVSFARRAPPPLPPAPVEAPAREERTAPPSGAEAAASLAQSPAPATSEPGKDAAPAASGPAAPATSTVAPPVEPGAGEAVTRELLRNQVTAFVRQQRESYTQDFVEECWIARQEGRREDERRACDGARASDGGGDTEARAQVRALFQDLSRNERHAQLTAQLQARNDQLNAIAAGGGVLGALAAERRSINRAYLAYLNGNQNTAASNFVTSTFANTGNPQAMAGFLQFICKEMPCIYEFTGFRVVKPKEVQEAEAAANAFPYTPTLFGRRK
jgi:hypothetical protein